MINQKQNVKGRRIVILNVNRKDKKVHQHKCRLPCIIRYLEKNKDFGKVTKNINLRIILISELCLNLP